MSEGGEGGWKEWVRERWRERTVIREPQADEQLRLQQ